MGKDVPFDKNAKCDNCGRKGAFDFMGDYLCVNCITESDDELEKEEYESEEE